MRLIVLGNNGISVEAIAQAVQCNIDMINSTNTDKTLGEETIIFITSTGDRIFHKTESQEHASLLLETLGVQGYLKLNKDTLLYNPDDVEFTSVSTTLEFADID